MDHLRDNNLNALRVALCGESEREPYVDLTAHVGEKSLNFMEVSGIRIDAKTKALTFENRDGRLFFVPNVDWWSTDACDQW
jgi:hypothetical protein